MERLKTLRGCRLYPPVRLSRVEEEHQSNEQKGNDQRQTERGELEKLVDELPSSRSSISSSTHFSSQDKELSSQTMITLNTTTELSKLKESLKSLSSSLTSTSTTRTSLLSTLESYTSQLHREIYLRSGYASATTGAGGSGMPVGLNTLGQHLKSESNSGVGFGTLGEGRSEEWDSVRKEVRAIKGLLLGRRNFMINGTDLG